MKEIGDEALLSCDMRSELRQRDIERLFSHQRVKIECPGLT